MEFPISQNRMNARRNIELLNHVSLMGRLTRDPELRRTSSGTAVTSCTLAVERDAKATTGEKETDFIDIVAFGATAENMKNYFIRGSMAAVSGHLQIREWTGKDGNKRRSAEVVAERVYFTDSKKNGTHTKSDSVMAPFLPNAPESSFPEVVDDASELPF